MLSLSRLWERGMLYGMNVDPPCFSLSHTQLTPSTIRYPKTTASPNSLVCYPPTMNPIREHRLLTNQSQETYATTHGISLSTLRRLEEGTLPSVPPTLPISDHEYNEWRRRLRQQLIPLWDQRPPGYSGHPFKAIMRKDSVHAVALTLRVPTKDVTGYLKSKRKTVPASILQALMDTGYPHLDDLTKLQWRYGSNND